MHRYLYNGRAMSEVASGPLRFDAFDLDEADARLKGRQAGRAASKSICVLCALARQPGTLTKKALLDAVWGHQHVSESVLKTTISQLRAALADEASNPRYIETASRWVTDSSRNAGQIPRCRKCVRPTPRQFDSLAMASDPRSSSGARHRSHVCRGVASRRWWQRQLVWVAGDAGVGKSTLLEASPRIGAVAIAQGQCVEQYGAGEPYLPVLQALGDLSREYPELARSCVLPPPPGSCSCPG